jgi:hypothetical protein
VEEYRIPLAVPSPTFSGIDLIPPSQEDGDTETDGQETYAMQPLHSEAGVGLYTTLGGFSPRIILLGNPSDPEEPPFSVAYMETP